MIQLHSSKLASKNPLFEAKKSSLSILSYDQPPKQMQKQTVSSIKKR